MVKVMADDLRPKTHARNGVTTNYGFNAMDHCVMKSASGGIHWRYGGR
jgi:hypothetical protein